MSWRKLRLAGSTDGNAAARFRCRSARNLSTAFFCAILILGGLTAQVAGQENPLREADAGYLQQLLPSLQKIQDESSTAGVAGNTSSVQFAPQGLPTQVGGGEQLGSQSNAGLWRPEPTQQMPTTPSAVDQTEARFADSRPNAPWPEVGSVSNSAVMTGSGKANPKSPATTTSGTALGKGSPKQSEGLGKLAAFKGVESLKLDSTVVKIGLNTLLVLAASIGLIVVVRRTMPRQVQAAKSPTGRLRIEQTLSLGGKAELKVVRCGLHQVLVAIDNGGIKSVVALEPSLEPERENLEPAVESQPHAPLKEPVNIEQFVKMIRDMEGDLMTARPGR
ncbi:MAG: flagellar biosynthetic protein FliO [Planctomycetota bacterium]